MIGQRFGNYRAVSLLGEGGMGAVYLAEHPDIGRRVAVKVLRPESIKDPQLLQRFLNEARAANAIRHPNIIEILDSGTTAEGTPYLVMELLEGEVLSARIARLGRLPLADALQFAYFAASALSAAHEKGIIHRDLKPDNLFIIREPTDPQRERLKVLDFGIAKLQTMPSGAQMQTRTGTLMGTPVYMSPEQCLGTKTIDARSDVYSLGVILFEMLVGRPPFMSEGFGALVNMHVNVPAPKLRELVPSIPFQVEKLVAKMLEKAPEARQRSADEVQADIRDAAGSTIVIRSMSSPDITPGDTLPGARGGSTLQLPPTSTTMSGGTGERMMTKQPRSRQASGKRAFLGGLAAVVVAGAGIWWAARSDRGGVFRPSERAAERTSKPPADPRAATDPRPDPKTQGPRANDNPAGDHKPAGVVRLSIDSQPAAVLVTDVATGRTLGTTPLVIQRPQREGQITARFEKEGYVTLTRMFTLDGDRAETVSLSALPTESGGAESDHKAAPKTKKSPKPHHQVAKPDDEPAKL